MTWLNKLFKRDYNNPPDFFQQCEDDFQSKFPEGRDDLWVHGREYEKIIKKGSGYYTRNRVNGEKGNKNRIIRQYDWIGSRIIWKVGDVVSVSDGIKITIKNDNYIKTITHDPKGGEVFGKLKLITIQNLKNCDILEFKLL